MKKHFIERDLSKMKHISNCPALNRVLLLRYIKSYSYWKAILSAGRLSRLSRSLRSHWLMYFTEPDQQTKPVAIASGLGQISLERPPIKILPGPIEMLIRCRYIHNNHMIFTSLWYFKWIYPNILMILHSCSFDQIKGSNTALSLRCREFTWLHVTCK